MLISNHYVKRKGEKSYKKFSSTVSSNGTIKEYLGFFPTANKRKNPDNTVKIKYSNFGRTFTRIVKNNKTGNSTMLVLKEKY